MKTKFKFLTALTILSMIAFTSCEKEEDKPAEKDPVVDNPIVIIPNAPTVKSNSIVIGSESIRTYGLWIGSAQSAANFGSNSLNLEEIRFFWNLTDTQSGMATPADGIYTLKESASISGHPADPGFVNMKVTVKSNLYSYYITAATSGAIEVKTVNGFTHLIFKDVVLEQFNSFGVGTPLVPASLKLSGDISGDPHEGVENVNTPNSMEYIFSDTTTSITSATVNIGTSNYININNGKLYIYFQANLGIPTPGDYTVNGTLANVFAYDSYKVNSPTECIIAYYKNNQYSIASGIILKVELVNGQTQISTSNVIMSGTSRDEAPFFPLSINATIQ